MFFWSQFLDATFFSWFMPILSADALKAPDLKGNLFDVKIMPSDISLGLLFVAGRVMNPTSLHEDSGSIPGLARWVCLAMKLWRGSQPWLGSCIAVAVAKAGHCSSSSTPSLGTSMCHSTALKNKQINKQTNQKKTPWPLKADSVRRCLPVGLFPLSLPSFALFSENGLPNP